MSLKNLTSILNHELIRFLKLQYCSLQQALFCQSEAFGIAEEPPCVYSSCTFGLI